MDVEIAIEGVKSPVDEERLRQLVASMPGVQEPTLYGGMLALRYDPTVATKVQICDSLAQAGFAVSILRAAPASPVMDAIKPR